MTRRAKVKVKAKSVTRAEAAAEFGRKKARQRRKLLKRRAVMVAACSLGAYALVGGWWLSHTGKLAHAYEVASVRWWELTSQAGFRIEQIELTGRTHADKQAVKTAIDVERGAPTLGVPLALIKQRLLAVPEIKSVEIVRDFPNKLAIHLTERMPVANWQHDGVQQLIDAEGVVLSRDKYRNARLLPVVVGADAPQHVSELLALLDSAPSIKPDVVAAVRVGSRRWNIQLTRDIVVMLPDENPLAAWKRFAALVEDKALLNKAVRSVDMRIDDRVFIMPAEEQKNPITLTGARDT